MSNLINRLSAAIHKRAEYRRTVALLSNLPIDSRLDLDIYHGDIRKLARGAVYGTA